MRLRCDNDGDDDDIVDSFGCLLSLETLLSTNSRTVGDVVSRVSPELKNLKSGSEPSQGLPLMEEASPCLKLARTWVGAERKRSNPELGWCCC